MITGILVALPEELSSLTKVKLKQGESYYLNKNTLLILSGTGSKNAQIATQKLINQGATQLISWGSAGAISPHLNAGDLIVPNALIRADSPVLTTHIIWSQLIINQYNQAIKCYNGEIFESHEVIGLAKDKTVLYQETSALAIDMESYSLAKIAYQAKLPFIVIRSIVDPASFDLPNAINHAMTQKGTMSVPKLIIYLIGHPTELPKLIRLGLNFKRAHKTLTIIASQILPTTQAQ